MEEQIEYSPSKEENNEPLRLEIDFGLLEKHKKWQRTDRFYFYLLILIVALPVTFGVGIASGFRKSEGSYMDSPPVETEQFGRERELIVNRIKNHHPNIDGRSADFLARMIQEESSRLVIPESMILNGRHIHPVALTAAVIEVESSFDERAVSVSDARGYMQIKPSTAQHMDALLGRSGSEKRLFEGRTNIHMGVDYLNHLALQMPNIRMVILAYNAGPSAAKAGLYHESYWRKVLGIYKDYMQEINRAPLTKNQVASVPSFKLREKQ